MHCSLPAVVIAALTTLASAQTFVSSPKGYLSTEGEVSGIDPGSYPGGRFMFFDGGHRGVAMTLKGTAYRLDNHVYSVHDGMGRSWSNVQIRMSECDYDQLSATFAKNPLTTPTLVFSANVTWPARTGKPNTLPAAWSLQFPFTTSWTYSGTRDLCLDYTFAGGVLANRAPWGSRTRRNYRLDSAMVGDERTNRSTILGRTGPHGCNDRGSATTDGAELQTFCTHYSSEYYKPGFAGTAQLTQTGKNFGPNATVVTMLGLRSSRDGWAFPGVTCNKVHVLSPIAFFPQKASASGDLYQLVFGKPFHQSVPGLAGTELATQAAWSDTRNGQLMISAATTNSVPEVAPARRRKILYEPDPTSPTGLGLTTNFGQNVLVRYRR